MSYAAVELVGVDGALLVGSLGTTQVDEAADVVAVVGAAVVSVDGTLEVTWS